LVEDNILTGQKWSTFHDPNNEDVTQSQVVVYAKF